MNDENGEQGALNPEGETTPEQTPEPQEESVEEIKVRLQKAEELAKNYKVRAEKAEQAAKKPEGETTPKNEGLTAEDVLAFTTEGVTHKEDIELAKKFAANSGVKASQILQDADFKALLDIKREQRKSSETTITKGGPKGVGKVSGEELLRRAAKNEFPESEEDINKMLDAKFEAKRKALQK